MEKKSDHYEYQNIEVKQQFKWLYLDYYPSFGWEVLETIPGENAGKKWHISLKRNYHIAQKDRLLHYQSHFDSCMEELRNMEISVRFSAVACALVIGAAGLFFLFGALALIGTGKGLGFFLMIPAAAAFLLAYPGYLAVFHMKKRQIDPSVKEHYEQLFQISQSARQILEKS